MKKEKIYILSKRTEQKEKKRVIQTFFLIKKEKENAERKRGKHTKGKSRHQAANRR